MFERARIRACITKSFIRKVNLFMKNKMRKTAIQCQYLGVGFIKSRKSDNRIMEMAEEMIAASEEQSLHLVEVVVDQGSGMDIGRATIDELAAWMEKDYISAVVVKSIFDISKDTADLMKFLQKAEQLGVSVYELEQGIKISSVPLDDCYGI